MRNKSYFDIRCKSQIATLTCIITHVEMHIRMLSVVLKLTLPISMQLSTHALKKIFKCGSNPHG